MVNPIRALVLGWLCGLPLAALAVWGIVDNDRLFFATALNGLTLAALYFLVASGFTLVFGLMRNVNLAHGSLYLLGGYVGWVVGEHVGLVVSGGGRGLPVRGADRAAAADRRVPLHARRGPAPDAWSTIALSIIARRPAAVDLGRRRSTSSIRRAGSSARRRCRSSALPDLPAGPAGRRPSSSASLLWLFLNRTRVGMMIRAGVDDRAMLAASGVNVQMVFADHLRDRRRPGRFRRRGRRHRAVDRAGRGHALPAGLAGRGHRRWHGQRGRARRSARC